MLLLLNIIFVVIIGRVAVEAAAAAIVHNLARLWLCMKLDGAVAVIQSSAQLRTGAGRVHVK